MRTLLVLPEYRVFENKTRMVGMKLLRRQDWCRISKVECRVEGEIGCVGDVRNEWLHRK